MKTLALVTLGLLLLVPLASANHPITEDGLTVTFDHDGDNEWWVEVLTRASGGSVVAMEVRAESSSTFRGLQQKSFADGWTKWGPETAFQIPAGDRVVFRAHTVSEPGGQVGTTDSCWFTHPAGVEQCIAPPPTSSWQVTPIGEAGISSHSGDMAISDADNDGRRDVTIGTRNGVYTFERDGASWSGQRVGVLTSISALAAGDGDGDGQREIYAMSNNQLVKYTFIGGVWQEQVIVTFPERFAGDMTLGDIDGAAGPEIYVGLYDTSCDSDTQLCSSSATVYHVRSTAGVWISTPIASLSGHLDSMWIGDGDRDGDFELYVGHGTRHADRVTQVEHDGSAWQTTDLPGTGSNSGYSLVVVGDGDRSGSAEVYTLNYEGHLRMLTFGSSGWTATDVFAELRTPEGTNLAPHTLFLGDGDGDGSQELYIGTDGGQVYQVRFTDGAWRALRIASPIDAERGVPGGSGLLVVGDGDGDGSQEVYAGISFQAVGTSDNGITRVYQIKAPQSGFDATFTSVRGNEWWVQADVKATGGTLSKVDVRLDDGAWKPLAKQSWGANAYAASYHITEGTVVQLRATSTTGATDLSDCYRWIPSSGQDATKTTCGTTPPPPPPTDFDATFTGVRGNEWWVQADVKASGGTLSKVDVRLNEGAWKPLAKQSWGANAYAASYHITEGTVVQLRATSTTGATDLSDCYRWIPSSGQDATKTTCGTTPPQDAFDATFKGVQGNEWWVQVQVTANEPVARVMVRVDCDIHWRELHKQSWGGWAASYHIPAGSKVDFQARTADFDSDVSGGYIWTAATPTDGCPQGDWPRQGSFVTYELGGGVCGGGECEESQGTMSLVYDQGRWTGVCEGEHTHTASDGTKTTEPFRSEHVGLPPSWLRPDTHVGAQHQPDMIKIRFGDTSCSMGWINSPVFVLGQENYETRMQEGDGPSTLLVWKAQSDNPDDNFFTARWDTDIGLVVQISSDPRRSGHGHTDMDLVATDIFA